MTFRHVFLDNKTYSILKQICLVLMLNIVKSLLKIFHMIVSVILFATHMVTIVIRLVL